MRRDAENVSWPAGAPVHLGARNHQKVAHLGLFIGPQSGRPSTSRLAHNTQQSPGWLGPRDQSAATQDCQRSVDPIGYQEIMSLVTMLTANKRDFGEDFWGGPKLATDVMWTKPGSYN